MQLLAELHTTPITSVFVTCKHLHKLAAHCAQECHTSLSRNGPGQVRLASAGGTLEDDALPEHMRLSTTQGA